jgi:hypothetical protein
MGAPSSDYPVLWRLLKFMARTLLISNRGDQIAEAVVSVK